MKPKFTPLIKIYDWTVETLCVIYLLICLTIISITDKISAKINKEELEDPEE